MAEEGPWSTPGALPGSAEALGPGFEARLYLPSIAQLPQVRRFGLWFSLIIIVIAATFIVRFIVLVPASVLGALGGYGLPLVVFLFVFLSQTRKTLWLNRARREADYAPAFWIDQHGLGYRLSPRRRPLQATWSPNMRWSAGPSWFTFHRPWGGRVRVARSSLTLEDASRLESFLERHAPHARRRSLALKWRLLLAGIGIALWVLASYWIRVPQPPPDRAAQPDQAPVQ